MSRKRSPPDLFLWKGEIVPTNQHAPVGSLCGLFFFRHKAESYPPKNEGEISFEDDCDRSPHDYKKSPAIPIEGKKKYQKKVMT